MAKERRDNKNRILRNGEYQRSDGKYEYKYIDNKGERHSVYSWKLVPSDKAPLKKECDLSLRELEKEITQALQDEIDIFKAQRTTLNSFFEVYIENRHLKDSTRSNYKYMYNKYVRDVLGYKRLPTIKYSDIKHFYNDLIYNKGFKPRSMEVINTILHPIFGTAVRDGFIRLNPTEGVMAEIKRSNDWTKEKRHALTLEQQNAFVSFISSSEIYHKWLPLMTVMLGTGCRIGEITGLCWQDIDFENGIINISHSLIYRKYDNGRCEFHITTPKTKNSIREIPMFEEVRDALTAEHKRQQKNGFVISEIDGYSGFVFGNRFGEVLSPHAINRAIERMYKAYNAEEEVKAANERRKPIILPHFSAHHLRHTFCTRMCENVSDKNTLNTIKEIMGHSDISTTLDVYTDLTREKKKEAFSDLQGKFKLN